VIPQCYLYMYEILGCVSLVQVHPSCGYFAVGEKGQQPVVAVYTYPDLRLHRVLQGQPSHSTCTQHCMSKVVTTVLYDMFQSI